MIQKLAYEPPQERGRAIGVWAGTAGIGVALGPLTGGFLLEHFYWGSIFLVNLPIVALGIAAGFVLIPTSKDPSAPQLDPVGAALSIVALVGIVYALIEAPDIGWTAPKTLAVFAGGLVALGIFVWWERRSDHPMLAFNRSKYLSSLRFAFVTGLLRDSASSAISLDMRCCVKAGIR